MDYVHQIPGRLRVQSSVLRRNAAKGPEAAALVKGIPGVESVQVSQATGSLVIYHRPDAVSADSLLGVLGAHGCLASAHRSARGRRVKPGSSLVSFLAHAVLAGVSKS